MELVITNSMRNVCGECWYRFFLEYVRRVSPRSEASYFKWGRIIHSCAESRDNGEDIEEALYRIRKETEEKQLPAREVEEIEEMCTLAPTVLDAHLLRWHEEDQHYELLGAEKSTLFELPLPSGFVFKGKIDRIVRDTRTGNYLVWERKTAAMTGEDFWTGKLLDPQGKGYCLAAQRCLGFDTRKVLYDVFKKPGIRQKQTQTREAFIEELKQTYLLNRDKLFERREFTFTQEELDAYYWDLDQVAQMIKWHLEEGIWPRQHSGNRKGGCDYLPICLDRNENNFLIRKHSCLNPELNGD